MSNCHGFSCLIATKCNVKFFVYSQLKFQETSEYFNLRVAALFPCIRVTPWNFIIQRRSVSHILFSFLKKSIFDSREQFILSILHTKQNLVSIYSPDNPYWCNIPPLMSFLFFFLIYKLNLKSKFCITIGNTTAYVKTLTIYYFINYY